MTNLVVDWIKKLNEENRKERSYSVIEVENTGWSNPEAPSWFTCMNGHDPIRFDTVYNALKYVERMKTKHDFDYRVVHRMIKEEYYY